MITQLIRRIPVVLCVALLLSGLGTMDSFRLLAVASSGVSDVNITPPPADPLSVTTVTYAEAQLDGYGVEKRGPVGEDSDALYDGEGYISYFFAEDESASEPVGSATFPVEVAEAGLYKLSIGYYIPEGYGDKVTSIQINGAGAGELTLESPAPGTVRAEKLASKVLLNAGSNTIKIMRGWGYYGIEHIKIEPANAPASGSKLEAEDGIMTGGVSIGTSGEGYSGEGYAAFQQSGSLKLIYKSSSASMYDIVIGYNSPNGDKKTSMVINGETSEITFAETTEFIEVSAGKALLNEGDNTLEFLPNWGWYNIDYVKLTPTAKPEGHDATGTLNNPESSPEARSLMNYLLSQYGRNIISGQQTLEDVEWINQQTGKYPAIFSTDLIDYSPSRVENGATSTETEKMIEWYKRGGIVALCWHWNAPKGIGGNEPGYEWWRGFYTEFTTFDVEYALNNPDSDDYRLLIRDIDAIAAQLKRLNDNNVPVLWRPLHEAEGGWFWWGAKGPESTKQLYRLMYDRLTNYHKLNNLIWVWNSENKDWYPGDDVVDMVSVDIYNPAGDYNPSIAKYEGLVSLVNDKKMVALAENGPIPDPELLEAYGADWSFFSTWTGDFIRDGKTNTLEHLKKVYNHDKVITLDELPSDLYPKGNEGNGGNTGNTGNTGVSGKVENIGSVGDTGNQGIQRVEVDSSKLTQALDRLKDQPAELQIFEVEVKGSDMAEVIIPAAALAEAALRMPNATILIKSDVYSYGLPVRLIDMNAVTKQLGIEAAKISIIVKMKRDSEIPSDVLHSAQSINARVVGDLFEFSIAAESGNESVEINSFGNTYVTRTITIPLASGDILTAVSIDPVTKEMSFVPATFATRDGKTFVTIKHNQNGRYTVVKLNRTFSDLEGHWAKDDIELMSNKLVINGKNEITFAPDQSITRAEFAVLISKALGLTTGSVTGEFSDVTRTDWYAGAVEAVSEIGVIQGFGDGTFQPNALITREQAAAMILRAAAIAGKEPAASGITLDRFRDSSSVSPWASHSIKQAIAAGLIQGETADRFAPKSMVNRSQTAVILKRLLVYMNFMNA